MQQREHSAFLIDGRQAVSLLQCCHCSAHRPRAEMTGFCRNCMGPTCKAQTCRRCIPFEKALDRMEKKAQTDGMYRQFTAR